MVRGRERAEGEIGYRKGREARFGYLSRAPEFLVTPVLSDDIT